MKSINFYFLLAVILCLFSVFSCKNPSVKEGNFVSENNGMYTASFSFDDMKESDIKVIPLSSLVEDCFLVQLETTREAFYNSTTGFERVTVTEKYIGVSSPRETIKLFDRSGRFLSSIGNRNSLLDEIIDDENGIIYTSPILVSDKILAYNDTGHFVGEFVTPHSINYPKLFLSDDVLMVAIATDNLLSNAIEATVYRFDVNTGDLLENIFPPTHLVEHEFKNLPAVSTRNIPGLFDFMIHTPTNNERRDTLYHIDLKNNVLKPFFTMKYENIHNPFFYHLTKDIIIAQTSKMIPAELGSQLTPDSKNIVVADLKSKRVFWANVVNDFYGNIPVDLRSSFFRNGYYARSIRPEALIKLIEERLADSNCSEEDKQILNKTLATINKESNNLVFIGKLKSEMKLW